MLFRSVVPIIAIDKHTGRMESHPEKTAGNDFRVRLHATGVFVDGDNGDDYAVFGKMLAVANYGLFDFFERTGVDEDAPSGYRVAFVSAIRSELQSVAVFQNDNFARHAAELIGERGVAEEMA